MILSPNKIIAYLTFGIGVVLFPIRTFACDCDIESPFIEVARQTEFVDLIVRGKISPHPESEKTARPFNLLELEVLKVIKGQEKRQTIRVWGDNRGLCRYHIGTFPVGTEWVMALHSVTPSDGEGFNKPEYVFDYCFRSR